jgi:carbonic anhydrase
MLFRSTLILTVALPALLGGSALASGPGPGSLLKLKAGNARFAADPAVALPTDRARRVAVAAGQSPSAMILSCADSSVPPEIIFNAGPGELFVVRAAGHVSDRAVAASLEYGAEHLDAPLLVVMGHESCGVVKAALESKPGTSRGPDLDYLIKAIGPAMKRSAPGDQGRIKAAILANVEESINDLLERSTILHQMAADGTLTIVGAYYELTTGRVHFSEPIATPSRPGTDAAAGSHE